jgi:hypothetical protein
LRHNRPHGSSYQLPLQNEQIHCTNPLVTTPRYKQASKHNPTTSRRQSECSWIFEQPKDLGEEESPETEEGSQPGFFFPESLGGPGVEICFQIGETFVFFEFFNRQKKFNYFLKQKIVGFYHKFSSR